MAKKLGLGLIIFIIIIVGGYLLVHQMNANNRESNSATSSQKAKMSSNHKAPSKTDQKTKKMIENMSLDEKIGQMIIAGVDGTQADQQAKALISNDKVGGIILYANNMESPEQTLQLVNDLKAQNKGNRMPLFLGVDQEGGDVSRLPGELTPIPNNGQIGKRNDKEYARSIGVTLGKQVQAFGFNMDFAPVMDVNSNPDNPVIGDRSFGDNPEIVSSLGIQTMQGIQSEGIIPVIKHFPGHGDTSEDSHVQLPKVDKNIHQLQQTELPPFENAMEQGADAVMVAHILLPKLDADYPASMSKKVIQGVLRDQLHGDGVVMTDDMTMGAIMDNFAIGEAAVKAVQAGSDIVMVAHDEENVMQAVKALKDAVDNGDLSEKRINESVERIIKLKRKYRITDEQVESASVDKLLKQK
ncbi:beta-N-acetylhexosaminidase [Lentibacillus sp. L22]|uniref:beta-N-acetylhexosaminidase n=1 Tax=Lentibacillus TaxID=175304 RepID=UPI0022B1C018|nr:beta-N-acetylhexosaminidase [Lentibacillus daqui]